MFEDTFKSTPNIMRVTVTVAWLRATLLLTVLAICSTVTVQNTHAQSEVMYRLTFTSTWSSSTHPMDFPSNPHYSSLRGTTHNVSADFFSEGALASPGIKLMAETGSNSTLESEIASAMSAGTALNNISGGFLSPSPGSLETTFTVTTSHPLVSVVAMLAPSPDWFIGLDGVDLYSLGQWVADTTIVLYTLDAGTDSGTSYGSPNSPTTPPVPISRIDVEPFLVNTVVEPVGTIQIVLETPLAIDPPKSTPITQTMNGPYPNPASGTVSVYITLDRPKAVTLAIFDVLGREVVGVHDGTLPQGQSTLSIDLSSLASGIYLLQAQTPQNAETRSFSVVR